MNKTKWKNLGLDFAKKMGKKCIGIYAGSATFFFLMSLIPTIMVLVSIITMTTLTEDDVVMMVNAILPDFADGVVNSLIDQAFSGSVSLLSFSILFIIWAGATGMMSMIRGLNIMDEVEDDRNYFAVRGIAALYTLGMIAVLLFMLVIMVFGDVLGNMLLSYFPEAAGVISVLLHAQFMFLILIGAVLLFALLYSKVPRKKKPYLQQLPGAIFSAIAWAVFSQVFSIYVNNVGAYNVYGSLATPVIVMFWMYTCLYIVFIGAFINWFLWDNKEEIMDGIRSGKSVSEADATEEK